MSLNLHNKQLDRVKKAVGASFVAYEKVGNTYFLKVIKDRNPNSFPLTGTPDDVTPARYNELIEGLKEFYDVKI